MFKKASRVTTFIGRFSYGEDLLDALRNFCVTHRITAGTFTLIGAVQNAKLGFYDQKKKRYAGRVSISQKLEITCCTGNISFKDGEIFVHAHITLADHAGRAFGGHLMPGTRIFAAEFCIQKFSGVRLTRKDDPVTGLSLWG
jgi:predicted DNA-binding protein with PD1-like motif